MSRVGTISSIIGYTLKDVKVSGTTTYLCYIRDTGWKIKKVVESGSDVEFSTATDHNNIYPDYASAVTNRASLTYV